MTTAAPAANTTLLAKPHSVQGRWAWRQPVTQGLFLNEGAGVQVTVGGPGIRETMGSSSTNWLEAGQCRAMSLSQEGPRWKIQVVFLCYDLPWGGGC